MLNTISIFRHGRLHIPLFSAIALLLAVLTACGGPDQTVQPTPTPPPLQFTTLNLDIPQQALTAPITGTVPDATLLHVGITFKINQSQLDQLGKDHQVKVNDNTSASDVATKLGIDDATYQQIKTFFGFENATLKLSKTRTNLNIDAKAGSFARLLQTRFVLHSLNGRTYYTPDPAKPPQVPTLIATTILAVTGLDNYSLPPEHRSLFGQTALKHQQISHADCTVGADAVTPDAIAAAYGFAPLHKQNVQGQNMTINLVEIDGFDNNDLSNYFSCVNFKGKLDAVNIDGPAPAAGGETTLDLEMIAGLASSMHIVDYQTDTAQAQNFGDVWGQVNDALQQIINDNSQTPDSADAVSMSLGLSEEFMTINDIKALDQSIQILNKALHMTVFVASGDCGAFTDHIYHSLSVSFPASDPYSVAVGGTVLSVNNQGARSSEVAWSDDTDLLKCQNQWGTGGGVSKVFTRPDWQTGTGVQNKYSDGKRQLPDISAVAYNLPIYFQGQWLAVGGTSAATPIWATGMSLVNQSLIAKQGAYFYGPDLFYGVSSSSGHLRPFYDVTHGNNLFYNAASGWDYTTGLGTPNLTDLSTALSESLH